GPFRALRRLRRSRGRCDRGGYGRNRACRGRTGKVRRRQHGRAAHQLPRLLGPNPRPRLRPTAEMRRLPNLVLIGFMATGKSTIGRRCAAALAYPFRDTDSWIEEREGRSITEIFAE